MKRRVVNIKQPIPTITIDQTPMEPETWDSAEFDIVPRELYLKLFERLYKSHKFKLAELAASRLSLDSAVTNVQNALNAEVGADTIQLMSDANKRSVEQAYTMALRWYVYNHVLGLTVDDATRKEVLAAFTNLHQSRASAPGSDAPKTVRGRSEEVEDALVALSKQLDTSLGAPLPERKPREAPKPKRGTRPIPPAPRRR